LTLTFASREWRFATESVVIIDADSEELRYEGGLAAPLIEQTFDFTAEFVAGITVPIEIAFSEDVAKLYAQGHRFSKATADLSLWLPGTAFEDRFRLMSGGEVQNPQFGAFGEPVSFSLAQRPFDDTNQFPPANARVGTNTWVDRASKASGLYYPFVFGTPGVFVDSDYEPESDIGSPALMVDINIPMKLLIAGHRVEATTVTILNETDGSSGVVSVVHERDFLGRECATVSLGGSGVGQDSDATYWTIWNGDGGGFLDFKDETVLEHAGEILRLFLDATSLSLDRGRLTVAQEYLDAYRLAFYIDEAVSPWEWILQHLLPILPISFIAGDQGLYPLVWNLDAVPEDAIASLVAGIDLHRTELVTEETDNIINEIRLSFVDTNGEFRRNVTINGDRFDTNDPNADIAPNHYSRVSQNRYDVRSESVDSSVIYDTPTAWAIAQTLIRAKAMPRLVLEYDSDVMHGWIRPGAVIKLTDDELFFENELVYVSARVWNGTFLHFQFFLIDDKPRNTLASTVI
jgi:hypothetical protein